MSMENAADRAKQQEDAIEGMMAREGLSREQSFTQLGVTPEFIWYEASILKRDMDGWAVRLQRLVDVAEQRHNDMNKMLGDVMRENRGLKQQLAALRDPASK